MKDHGDRSGEFSFDEKSPEKQNIDKILSLQQQGVTLLWTAIVSVSIGLSNYFFPLILNHHGDAYVLAVLGVVATVALMCYAVRWVVRFKCGKIRHRRNPMQGVKAGKFTEATAGGPGEEKQGSVMNPVHKHAAPEEAV